MDYLRKLWVVDLFLFAYHFVTYFPVIELRYPADFADTVSMMKKYVENVKMDRMKNERDFMGRRVKECYRFGIANPEERKNYCFCGGVSNFFERPNIHHSIRDSDKSKNIQTTGI
jgi:hypothetical protein